MTFLRAAEEVLRDSKHPMTTAEITEVALHRGLLRTNGKTPAASMAAALYLAPADGPIHREFRPGRQRAARNSVRWTYSATC
jgi:hypothetical protein